MIAWCLLWEISSPSCTATTCPKLMRNEHTQTAPFKTYLPWALSGFCGFTTNQIGANLSMFKWNMYSLFSRCTVQAKAYNDFVACEKWWAITMFYDMGIRVSADLTISYKHTIVRTEHKETSRCICSLYITHKWPNVFSCISVHGRFQLYETQTDVQSSFHIVIKTDLGIYVLSPSEHDS